MTRAVVIRNGSPRLKLGSLVGSYPGQRSCRLPEHRLRDDLARSISGITEAVLPYGRADVATETHVFEVERAEAWRDAVRQVLAYSAQCGLVPAIALFGATPHDVVLGRFLRLRDGRPPIALWWHNGWSWEFVRSRRDCRTMRAPQGLL